jgi:hypothetical protein
VKGVYQFNTFSQDCNAEKGLPTARKDGEHDEWKNLEVLFVEKQASNERAVVVTRLVYKIVLNIMLRFISKFWRNDLV